MSSHHREPNPLRRAVRNTEGLRLGGAADLIAATPYLVGFHPEQSLVLVALDAENLVVFTARVDLADAGHVDCLDAVRAAVLDSGTAALVALVFAEGALQVPEPVAEAVDAVLGLETRTATEVLDVVACDGRRWRSLLCSDPECCPAEGQPVPPVGSSAVAASATVAGLVAWPSREDLRRSLDGQSPDERAARRGALVEHQAATGVIDDRTRRRREVRALFAAARAAERQPAGYPSEDELVRLACALTDISVRDSLWIAVDDGRLPGRALWQYLAARLPAPYDAPPLFLLGWASWRRGEATLAAMAVEKALESDPGYSAADLLLAALSRGVDPHRLPRLNARSTERLRPRSTTRSRRSA